MRPVRTSRIAQRPALGFAARVDAARWGRDLRRTARCVQFRLAGAADGWNERRRVYAAPRRRTRRGGAGLAVGHRHWQRLAARLRRAATGSAWLYWLRRRVASAAWVAVGLRRARAFAPAAPAPV